MLEASALKANGMPEVLALIVAEHGGFGLPWVSTDHPTVFSWRCDVRHARVEFFWRKEAWVARATDLETGSDGESTFVPGAPWRDHALARLFTELSQPDPRLASLPADLQAVAAEFLSLHQCWGTEFEVSDGYCLAIQWVDREAEESSVARFEWYAKSYAFVGAGSAWNVLGRQFNPGTYDEVEGVRISSHGPLRRSEDFATFVQRFRSEG